MRLAGVQNGTGALPQKGFGNGRRRARKNGAGRAAAVPVDAYLDARHPLHLALPRPIAPYSVIRTTENIAFTAGEYGSLIVLGPMREFGQMSGDTPNWSNVIAVSGNAHTAAINAAGNTMLHVMSTMSSATLNNSSVCPSAFTVQIMNGEPLQTTAGIAYAGMCGQCLRLCNSADTWDTLTSELTSYTRPRLLAASKLGLRGVQVNAIPADMNEMSEFARVGYRAKGSITWSTSIPLHFAGMLPIWMYVPEGLTVNFFITVEWRTRFEPGNPAHASHTYHHPASLNTWNRVIQSASSAGSVVRDIVEVAAMAGRAAQMLRGQPALPMLPIPVD
jgi:hypothetical protein